MSDYTPPTLVTPTPGGSAGDGTMNGALNLQASSQNAHGVNLITYGSNKIILVQTDSSGDLLYLATNGNRALGIGNTGQVSAQYEIQIYGKGISLVNNVNTVGYGFGVLYGKDVRTGLTAVDASATTLYTTTAAGQLYRLMGRVLATAGTSPSATYTIKWTEGGATITKTLTISALDSDSDLSILIQPDNATAITAQLTAISGTGTTVNVAATVEELV